MLHTTKTDRKVHEGRNVKRPDSYRDEMLGIKQDALAVELGDDWNQQKISLLEQKETIDAPLLQQISAALKIPVEAIQNFDEIHAINIIAQTVNNHDQSASVFYNSTINPVEPIIKLHEEKIELYERMLKEKDEMVATLQSLLQK
ncbi:MAG TPA: XRE family transcriptional regulator [Chitinophagaceae bacterium]